MLVRILLALALRLALLASSLARLLALLEREVPVSDTGMIHKYRTFDMVCVACLLEFECTISRRREGGSKEKDIMIWLNCLLLLLKGIDHSEPL